MSWIKEVTKDYATGGIKRTRRSYTGRRVFLAEPWEDAELLAPKHGEEYPGRPALTVDSLEFLPAGAPVYDPANPARLYTTARVIVDYTSLDLDTGAYEMANATVYPLILQIPTGLVYDSDAAAVENVVNITISIMDFQILDRRPIPQWPGILTCMNKVNSMPWRGFEVGTLLYNGPDMVKEYDPIIGINYRIVHKFSWNMLGWNSIPRGSVWDATTIYGYAQFQSLQLGD